MKSRNQPVIAVKIYRHQPPGGLRRLASNKNRSASSIQINRYPWAQFDQVQQGPFTLIRLCCIYGLI